MISFEFDQKIVRFVQVISTISSVRQPTLAPLCPISLSDSPFLSLLPSTILPFSTDRILFPCVSLLQRRATSLFYLSSSSTLFRRCMTFGAAEAVDLLRLDWRRL